ncbi:hypothetical protein KCU99_g2524, partial [Aureobasidium melanogenum]
MIDLTAHISDDAESISTSSFTPPPPQMAPKVAYYPPPRVRGVQETTITILLDVKTWEGDSMQSMQIKMRRDMSFGQLVAMLRARFHKTDDFNLRMEGLKMQSSRSQEWRMIFHSDTPASLHLADRARLQFARQVDIEVLDVSTM